jgi:hypothetical protein
MLAADNDPLTKCGIAGEATWAHEYGDGNYRNESRSNAAAPPICRAEIWGSQAWRLRRRSMDRLSAHWRTTAIRSGSIRFITVRSQSAHGIP